MRLWRALSLTLVASLVTCTEPEPRRVRLDLAHRSSCGASPRSYDATCIAAVAVQVRDLDTNTIVALGCTPLPQPFESIYDLIASNDVLDVIRGLDPVPRAVVELRGYHAIDKEPCGGVAERDLMFWGTSPEVDLTDVDLEVISIAIECRPICHCANIGQGGCTPDLEPGVCGPTSPVSPCRRSCGDDDDCYDGLLTCAAAGRCEPLDGMMCDPCAAATECDSALCVARDEDVDEQFCGLRCPPLGGAAACPRGMACRRLDGARYTSLP